MEADRLTVAAGTPGSVLMQNAGGAVARVAASQLKEMVLTDTIASTEAVRVAHNIRVISIAPLIGEAIARIAKEESVSSLFN